MLSRYLNARFEPLLCLETLGSLALREDFRHYLCENQTAIFEFLVLCVQNPSPATTPDPGSRGESRASAGGGGAGGSPVAIQRAAAKCLANLSLANSSARIREWARKKFWCVGVPANHTKDEIPPPQPDPSRSLFGPAESGSWAGLGPAAGS